MNLGNRLKKLRASKGVNQKELAQMLNIDRSTYGKYETGDSSPDYDKLVKLADYFNVSIDYLLGRTNIKNDKSQLPTQFTTPEEAMEFIIKQPAIMGFGGFDVEKMSDEEVVEFANELLRQLQLISYKYK